MHIEEKLTKSKPRRKLASVLLLCTGLAFVTTGVYMIAKRQLATRGTAKLPNTLSTVVATTKEPDEKKLDDNQIATYSVPADQPRSIRIASASISGLLQKVGKEKNEAISVPTNIHFGGWYTESVLPGEKGLSIIDGHYTGRYGDAIFKTLSEVKPGDEIQVEFGDKSIRKFNVVELKKLPQASATDYLFTQMPGVDSQLNLVTCGGKINAATNTYDDRIIVVSKLIN